MGPVPITDDMGLKTIESYCFKNHNGQDIDTEKTEGRSLARPLASLAGNTGARQRSDGVRVDACYTVRSFNKLRESIYKEQESNPLSVATIDPDVPLMYFKRGAAVSDILCDNWFEELDGARRAYAQANDYTVGLGALATSVMAFTQSPQTAIGIVSETFHQTGLWVDSLENNYLLAENLPTIRLALSDYRTRIFTAVLENDQIKDMEDAERILAKYDRTCSALGVDTFIRLAAEAGGKGDVLGLPEFAELPLATQKAIQDLMRQVPAMFGRLEPMSDSELLHLTAYIQLREGNAGTYSENEVKRLEADLESKLSRKILVGNRSRAWSELFSGQDDDSKENIRIFKAILLRSPASQSILDQAEAYLKTQATIKTPEVSDATVEDVGEGDVEAEAEPAEAPDPAESSDAEVPSDTIPPESGDDAPQ
jgi:hypothetical protein